MPIELLTGMIIKIVAYILFLSCILCGKPAFEILSVKRCFWEQGRKETGVAYKYEIAVLSTKKVRNVSFEYLYLKGDFIPFSEVRDYRKIKADDTITLQAIQFVNRTYKQDSIYLDEMEHVSNAILYRQKNKPFIIEPDTIQNVDCSEKIRRM